MKYAVLEKFNYFFIYLTKNTISAIIISAIAEKNKYILKGMKLYV